MPQGGVANALGSVFRTQKVQIGQIAYNSGATIPLDIPRGLLLKRINIRLSGSVVFATNPVTSVNSETPLGLLKRIELTADGRKPFFSVDGRMQYRRNQFDRSKAGELTGITSTAVNTYPVSAYISLDCESVRSVNPIFSYLDTRLYDNLRINITWGAITDIVVPGTSTVTITGVVADIQAEFTTEGFEHVLFNKVVMSDEFSVVSTSSQLKQIVPRNGLLQSILFRSDIDQVVSDTQINNITLRSENSVLHMDHLTWATLQSANTVEYELDSAVIGARISGYALHELSEDFDFLTSLDTAALNTLDLLFDVTLQAGTSHLIKAQYVFLEPAGR